MNMAYAKFESISRKLARDPRSVLAAARNRPPSEGLVLAQTWDPRQGITADDIVDLFLSYLKESDVPNSRSPSVSFGEIANTAFTGMCGISRIGPALENPRLLHRVVNAWSAIFKWSAFFFSTRIEALGKNDGRRMTAINVLSVSWYTLCSKVPILERMIATPMTVEIVTRLWLEEDNGLPNGVQAPAGTCLLGKILRNRDQLDRTLSAAGGKADEIAKLALSRFKAVLKASPLNGTHLSMHLDFINSLSRVADHPLRYALLGTNVVWFVTSALAPISIQVNLGRDPSFLDAMVSGFGYLYNCLDSTDGFTWVSQSVGAGLLTSFVDCSPQFYKLVPEDLRVVLQIVKNILPRYTVYRSVLEAMDIPMAKINKGPQRERVMKSVAKDVWLPFSEVYTERMEMLRYARAIKGQHMTCDNAKCRSVGTREDIRRCSACLTTFYCSKECQAIAWKEGDHKNVCKMKQRERTEGKVSKILKRDSAFFHNISVFDARKNTPKLRRQANKEYPESPSASFAILTDFTVTPAVYDLKPIEQYSPDAHSPNAQARNDAMVERARDHPEKYTLIESSIAHGQHIFCILTIATGDFWDRDVKEEQRGRLTDAQLRLDKLVAQAEERLPDSGGTMVATLADLLRTDFPEEVLMALEVFQDAVEEDVEFE